MANTTLANRLKYVKAGSLSLTQLKDLYNSLVPDKPIKGFSSKALGARRLIPLLEAKLATRHEPSAKAHAPRAKANGPNLQAKQLKTTSIKRQPPTTRSPRKIQKYKGRSIMAICQELINSGISEEKAKAKMVNEYGIPAKKLSYYNWNRNYMVRNGLIAAQGR